jgi:hypothetical protein
MRNQLLVLAIFMAACGGGTTTATVETNTAHEHEGMSPEVEAFHEVLAPLWHQDPGPGRGQAACAASADLNTRAEAVAAAQPGDESAALVSRAHALAETCANDPGVAEGALGELHEAFHALIE